MHKVMTKQWMLIIVSLVLLLAVMPLLAACGDDDEDDDIDIAPVTTTSQPPTTSQPAGLGFSVDSTIAELAANPCARTILAKYFGGEDKVQMAEQAVPDFTMRDAQKMSDAVSSEQLEQMDAELKAIVSCEETTPEEPAGCLSQDSTLDELTGDPGARAILLEYISEAQIDMIAQAGMGSMTLREGSEMGGSITPAMAEEIDGKLTALCGGEPPATTTEPAAECDLTIDSKLGAMMENPDAKAILEKHLPDTVMSSPQLMTLGAGMTLGQIASAAGGMITDEMLEAIGAELAELCGGRPAGGLLTIESKLGELMENPDAKAILVKHLPDTVMSSPQLMTLGAGMTLGQIASAAGGMITDEMLAAVAAELEALGAYASTAATTAPTKTPSKLTGDPVKIGVLVAYTGPTAMAGLLTDQCLEVADYLIEERGGVLEGRPVKWEKYDSGGDIAKAQSGVQKLASDDDVMAVTLGGVTPGELAATMILTTELKIPYFSAATSKELPKYSYAIRAAGIQSIALGELCANYALENLDPDTVAILAVNTEDAHDFIPVAEDIFEDGGVEIVYEQFVNYETTDLNPYLTRVKAEDPDLFYYFFDNAATNQSMFQQIMGLGGWGDIKTISPCNLPGDFAGMEGAEGTFFSTQWIPGLPYEGAQKFEQAWQAVHGSAPTNLHAMVFEGIWAAVEAVDQAGADREDIAELIRSGTFGFDMPAGPVVFDTDGEPSIKGFMATIQDGKIVPAP